jgi:hypothetical protein
MLAWIKENWNDVLAAIGAAYTLALLIVKLTPTPKDDTGLAKVSGWLKVLAKVFGLNLFQGVNSSGTTTTTKPGASRPTAALLIIGLSLAGLSCATLTAIQSDERAQLQIAQETFTATVQALTTAREAGTFTQEQADQITVVIAQTKAYLNDWTQAVKVGESRPKAWDEFLELITKLNALKEAS